MKPYMIALRKGSTGRYNVYARRSAWLGYVTNPMSGRWWYWHLFRGYVGGRELSGGHYETRHEAVDALWKAHRNRNRT